MLHIPHAFQMHRANFHNMPNLFTLQNAVAATTGHSGRVPSSSHNVAVTLGLVFGGPLWPVGSYTELGWEDALGPGKYPWGDSEWVMAVKRISN